MDRRQELEQLSLIIREIATGSQQYDMVEITMAYDAMEKEIDEVESKHLADCVRSFGSSLGHSDRDIEVASDMVEAVVPQSTLDETFQVDDWDLTPPAGIAAAIMYLVGNLPQSSKKSSACEISSVTGVSLSTIEACYGELYPYVPNLVPKYFASNADIRQLPHPCLCPYDKKLQAALLASR